MDAKAVAQKRWYEKNKATHMANVAARRKKTVAENRANTAEYLTDHPCVDCGEVDIRVLDFDHIADDKTGNISKMVLDGLSWKTILKEIEKCEVRCKNDHARRTYERLGRTWHDMYLK